MIQLILTDIARYIDFLRSSGYAVSVCCFDTVFSPCLDMLCQYEIHPLAICDYWKSNPATEGLCSKNKRRLLRRQNVQLFYSCCYAGVEEYVVPVRQEGRTILCVNVSGYRGSVPRSEKTRKIMQRRYGLQEEFQQMYAALSLNLPDQERILAITSPLSYMFRQLYQACSRIEISDSETAALYHRILRKICDEYMNPITAENIAAELHYSASYIRALFKKKSGRSIHAYLNEVRLRQAASLLTGSSFPVTQIAHTTGFGDSNYFSTAFKARFGSSPQQYRKERQ